MKRALRHLLLPLLLAGATRPDAAASQVPAPRVVSGRVLAVDGGGVAGAWVRVRTELSGDSVRLDSTGVFTLRVPPYPASEVELAVLPDTLSPRLYPALLRFRPGRPTERLAVALLPRWWTVSAGRYAGTRVAVDPREATAPPCPRCTAFWRAPLGDSLPGRAPGIPTWPDSAFPLKTALDHELGPRIPPQDSAAFWRTAEALEELFGRDLFQPAPLHEVLEPEEDERQGPVLVSVDPTLRTEGWGSSAAQGGDLLAAAVIVRTVSAFSGPDAVGLVMHELMHALSFGHTCRWRTVVADSRCPGRRAPAATVEDIAYAQLLWRIRALERELGTSVSVRATLAALESLPDVRAP